MTWDTVTWIWPALFITSAASVFFVLILVSRSGGKTWQRVLYTLFIIGHVAASFYFVMELIHIRGTPLDYDDFLGPKAHVGTELVILSVTQDEGKFYHVVRYRNAKVATTYLLGKRYEPGSYVVVAVDSSGVKSIKPVKE